MFKLERVRPALVADGLAEMNIRWPSVPVVSCETRQLAEEWTYRFLAAARAWADTETASSAGSAPNQRPQPPPDRTHPSVPDAPEPHTAEVRAWARAAGLAIPARGKLPARTWAAWRAAHHS